ncbi:MAG: HAD-IB family phosphatase [Anaerolineales bacterium]|nr:HAD-IB family phosphatase [Anaerolineales bacterium]MCB9146786.1 HAD-IB family phosphatase [Anaerolineales bacterium]
MIVLSDMMGTLTTGSPFLGLVDWVKHNQSKVRAAWYKTQVIPAYILAKRGWIDWQEWGQQLMIDSLDYIKDANPENLRHASEWVVEHDLWKNRREDVIARLVAHREQGAKVYIASSVIEPFIEPFAERIGAQTIGTPVEIRNGKIKMTSGLVANEKKIEQVLSRLAVDRVDVAYGDTILDVPMLEHADHPVAVYPDEKLRKIATERGWEIIGNTQWYGK